VEARNVVGKIYLQIGRGLLGDHGGKTSFALFEENDEVLNGSQCLNLNQFEQIF
jgi:hypothetical protein